MHKGAFSFLPFSPDSNRNKSIISYDISESEANKSKTIDSLLPKKATPKFDLSVPIGPEPIRDFIPSTQLKKKDKKKEKNMLQKTEATKIEVVSVKTEALIKVEKEPISTSEKSITPITAVKADSIKQLPLVLKTATPLVPKTKVLKSYAPGLFHTNLLKAHELNPKIKNKENIDWVTSVLLVVVAIVCILNVSYRSRLRQLFNAFASNRFVGQIVREENVMLQRISIFLSLLFLFVTSLFIFQTGRFFKLPFSANSSFINYSVILFALFAFYFIKISVFNFLGFLLRIEKEMKEYVFTLFLYNHFIGLSLIPVVIFLSFVPGANQKGVFIAGALLFVFAFILRTFRSYGNASGPSHFSVFYLFLYLCALEILPLVVITKLISNIV